MRLFTIALILGCLNWSVTAVAISEGHVDLPEACPFGQQIFFLPTARERVQLPSGRYDLSRSISPAEIEARRQRNDSTSWVPAGFRCWPMGTIERS